MLLASDLKGIQFKILFTQSGETNTIVGSPIPVIPLIDTHARVMDMKYKTVEDKDTHIDGPPEIIFFLGAGASVPAGISANS